MTVSTTVFWLSVLGVVYPYLGYPLGLWLLRQFRARPVLPAVNTLPSVSIIIPVHNEQNRIGRKLVNTSALDYPADRLEVLFVSDGSTDATAEMVRRQATPGMRLIELPARGGKAAALNAGLAAACHEILVFTDASIELRPDALRRIVQGFQRPEVGCVSGEDIIADTGGEALYGRYELTLRRLESDLFSIVGASGSFYAQRRVLCRPFTEGMAPDFLSVLRTVEQGYRAISDPQAVGTMTAVKDPKHEFERKVRTLLRGMTTLFAHGQVLNPRRFPLFAFSLWSHKVMRWLAPVFMVLALISPLFNLASPWYALLFASQVAFYGLALAGMAGLEAVQRTLVGKVALFFSLSNAAVLAAWIQYARGVRQELWTPSRR